jgi:hypothetical protein
MLWLLSAEQAVVENFNYIVFIGGSSMSRGIFVNFKLLVFVFLSLIGTNVLAFDPDDDLVMTGLCHLSYDQKNKYYYCGKKISKVYISFEFDDYYKDEGKQYAAFSRKIIVGALNKIRNDVKQYSFKVVDLGDVRVRPASGKNEAIFHFKFSKPDFREKLISVSVFAKIGIQTEVIDQKIPISNDEDLSSDTNKNFDDIYSCFAYLYSTDKQ